MSAETGTEDQRRSVSFGEALAAWAKIGVLSFGGPAGQIALMHRVLVEEKRWVDEPRFLHALNYCMLLPGPEAQQLATYVGWLLHGIRGGLVAGTLFVLPGTLVMLGLSLGYAAWHELAPVQAAFLGIKAAVLAIVLQAVIRIGRKTLTRPWLVAVALLAFMAIFVFHAPFPSIVIGAALIGLAARGFTAFGAVVGGIGDSAVPSEGARDTAPSRGLIRSTLRVAALFLLLWAGAILLAHAIAGPDSSYAQASVFFSKLAVVTFGGAYAVLGYMAQQAVELYGWLSPGEMLDGLGLAETTPGPLILVVQFVAFLGTYRDPGGLDPMLGGIAGLLLATWVTFVPCFLWIFLGAPFVERLRNNRALAAALQAITAAVVGVILNLAIWFGLHVLFGEVTAPAEGAIGPPLPTLSSIDPVSAGLALLALLALFRLDLGMPKTLALCAGFGLLINWGLT